MYVAWVTLLLVFLIVWTVLETDGKVVEIMQQLTDLTAQVKASVAGLAAGKAKVQALEAKIVALQALPTVDPAELQALTDELAAALADANPAFQP